MKIKLEISRYHGTEKKEEQRSKNVAGKVYACACSHVVVHCVSAAFRYSTAILERCHNSQRLDSGWAGTSCICTHTMCTSIAHYRSLVFRRLLLNNAVTNCMRVSITRSSCRRLIGRSPALRLSPRENVILVFTWPLSPSATGLRQTGVRP